MSPFKPLVPIALILIIASLSSAQPSRGSAAARPTAYPMPAPPADDSNFGARIQRTMTLLATSTPEHRNPVKILFYGQSITQQKWTEEVSNYIRKQFPNADLAIENRAIGGFASQLLVRTAEYDLYPFYPDLVIFNVYGDHNRYEEIIRNIRTRTTAEVAIHSHHVGGDADKRENFADDHWTAFMEKFIPQTAEKYGCEFMDVHEPWKQYLRENKLKARDLLTDDIHLNDHGCFVLAEFVKRHLVYKPQFPADPCRTVTTFTVGKDVSFKDGKLTLEFTGNRIDAISARTEDDPIIADVLIDGRKPSEFPELYIFTRPTYVHDVWPAIKRISSEKPLIVEEWTARVFDANDFAKQFKFEVIGSVTGPDGFGSSDKKFVSSSGRIVIEPNDWHLRETCEFKKLQLPENFKTTWKVVPLFVDKYQPPKIEDSSREYVTTLAQGLANSTHKLELIPQDGKPLPIKAIRIYRPPF